MHLLSFVRCYAHLDRLGTQAPWIHAAAVTVPSLISATGLSCLLIAAASVVEPGFQWQRGDDVSFMSKVLAEPIVPLVVAPVLLELVFRMGLFRFFRIHLGFFGAALTSAVLYGMLQLDPIVATIFALTMTLLYVKTETILMPIAVHALLNFFDVVVGRVFKTSLGSVLWVSPEILDPMPLAIFTSMFVVGLPGIYWLLKELLTEHRKRATILVA